jgi:hypothetical protein
VINTLQSFDVFFPFFLRESHGNVLLVRDFTLYHGYTAVSNEVDEFPILPRMYSLSLIITILIFFSLSNMLNFYYHARIHV